VRECGGSSEDLLGALIAILLLAPAATAARETVALLPATGANVEPAELAAATDVLRAQLERTGRYAVVMAEVPTADREATAAEAIAAGRAVGAPLAATLRVSRLADTGLVRFAVYRDGAGPLPVHVDELPAKGADDLLPALQRLAEGFATGTPAASLARIDTVTEREADPRLYKQRSAARLFGVRLGSTFVLDPADGRDRAAVLSGLGFAWHYDARSFMADVGLDLQWSQTLDPAYSGRRDWLFALGIGAYYPFARGDAAPYIGGVVSYLWQDTGAGASSGIALRPALGLVLGRLSSVQLRLDAGYQVNTFEERDGAGRSHRGHGPVLSFAVAL
jgi:hypothetical protein